MEWKPLTLMVSDCGDITAFGLNKPLSHWANARGYAHIKITVHRAVAAAFHGNPKDPALVVDHINGDPRNNHPSNLRWVTQQENILNRVHSLRKLTDAEVLEIRHMKPKNTENLSEMARRFGVSYSALRAIRHGKTHRSGYSRTNRTILSSEQVRKTRRWEPPITTAPKVARLYGVSAGLILSIWKTV